MAEKWNADTTIFFIQEYKCYECLWNTKSSTHKLKHVRDASWHQVANAMNIQGFGPAEAKQKMRNLRSTYYQEKNKIKKSVARSGESDEVYIPNIKWFNEMDTLLKKIDNPERDSMKFEHVTVETSSQNINFDLSAYEGNEVPSTSSGLTGKTTNLHVDIEAPDNNSKRKKKADSKRKQIYKAISEFKIIQEIINKESPSAPAPTLESKDQFDIFGSSVAAQLKSLPVDRAVLAQSAIQTILSDHAIAYLTGAPLRIGAN